MVYGVRRLLGRHSVLPEALFRCRPNVNARIRPRLNNEPIYDFTPRNGMYQPSPDDGIFHGPNGLSLGNLSRTWDYAANHEDWNVYIMPAGLKLPEDLVVLHEYREHFSLQSRVPLTPEALEVRLTKFLKTLQVMTTEDFIQKFPSPSG